jgi:hypothetical protein
MSLSFLEFLQLGKLALHHPVGVFRIREFTAPDILDILGEGLDRLIRDVLVLLHEHRREGLEDPQNVTTDHQLSVDVDPRTDAVDRDLQIVAHDPADLGRHCLDQDREGPRRLDCPGVLNQFHRRLGCAPLGLEAAELTGALWG